LGEAEVNIGQRHEGGDERRHKIAEAEGQAEERKVCEPSMRRRGRNGAPSAHHLQATNRNQDDGRCDRLGCDIAHPLDGRGCFFPRRYRVTTSTPMPAASNESDVGSGTEITAGPAEAASEVNNSAAMPRM